MHPVLVSSKNINDFRSKKFYENHKNSHLKNAFKLPKKHRYDQFSRSIAQNDPRYLRSILRRKNLAMRPDFKFWVKFRFFF